MRTVDKALKLLDFFTDRRAEIGLSELARLSGIDKATTHRMATVLCRHGFLEQHPQTKAYRLGAGVLRLARLREACFPVDVVVNPVLRQLADETEETAHASLLAGEHLAAVGSVEPDRGNRVHIEPGLILPFHATASGLAFLAFARPEFVEKVLAKPLERFTEATDCDPENLRERIDAAARFGVAVSDMGFESDVCSTAAPIFGATAEVCGAVTVAAPSARMNDNLRQLVATRLTQAALAITKGLGGTPSEVFVSAIGSRAA